MKLSIISLIFMIVVIGCSKKDNIVDSIQKFDYSIDQKVSCNCPEVADARIFIVADTIGDAISLSDGLHIPHQYWESYRTIKGLHEFISKCDTSLFNIEVEYDSLQFYPSLIAMYPKPDIGP